MQLRLDYAPQSARDERVSLGDDQRSPGPSGGRWGMIGGRAPKLLNAYLGLGVFILAIDTVNVFSTLHDINGRAAFWEPFVWEYSSGALSLALMPLVAMLARMAPPRRPYWRFALIHGLGTLAYSLIHVGGFLVLRKVIYAGLGHAYRFNPLSEFFYEYRKDLLGYAITLIVFVFAARLATERPAASTAAPPTPANTYDIQEGARLIRVRISEIMAAKAAGNYVEFHLVDGRRPLTRATLAKVSTALALQGFVRTHRSWLVNPACIRGLSPEGTSGDFKLELGNGVEAPVSRRFSEALLSLRRSASS